MKAVHLRIALLASALGATQVFGGLALNSGTSYDVTFSYQNIAKVNFATKPSGVGNGAHAGFYKLSVTDGTDTIPQIVSFCIELTETISGTNQMTYWGPDDLAGKQLANLDANQVAALDAVFGGFYVGTTVNDWVSNYGGSLSNAVNHARALQMVVWEITHETGNTWDLSSGGFSYTAGSLSAYGTELGYFNALLTDLNSQKCNNTLASNALGGVQGFLNYGNSGDQDQAFYIPTTPVPEPSVLGLQALVVAALILRRRRRA